MAVLNIRNLPDEVRDHLRIRAAKAGISMEAEARSILTLACFPQAPSEPPIDLQKWVDRLYGKDKPGHVVDELIAERHHEAIAEVK